MNDHRLNGHRVYLRGASFLVIAGSLLLLTACQGLAGGNHAATPGALAPNPSQISFGNTKVGSSQTSTITVSNSGGSTVAISEVNVTGAAFSVSGLNNSPSISRQTRA